MTRTTYVNASGLPADAQITTARDQALLGRIIQDRFPKYYRYFSTSAFHYHGIALRNHNHLLGRVDGIDGIKTGYTQASGFNLVSSVRRGDRHIVAVVLGGTSGGARDARMRGLIEEHIAEASTRRTAPTPVEAADAAAPKPASRTRLAVETETREPSEEPASLAARADISTTAAIPPARPGSSAPIQPITVKTIAVKTANAQPATFGSLVAPAPQASLAPAPLTATAHAAAPASTSPAVSARPLAQAEADAIAPKPPGARPGVLGVLPVQAVVATSDSEPPKPAPVSTESPSLPAATATRPVMARGAWMIQIGAFADETEARQHLQAAKTMAQNLLNRAESFTEKVVKGSTELYRARFAGFEKAEAEAACHYFKRNDIACMAIKNN